MAKDLYKSYCAKDAVDRIKFDEDIVSELAEGKIQAQFGILKTIAKQRLALYCFIFLMGVRRWGDWVGLRVFFFLEPDFFKWSNCFDCISFNILI